MCCQQKYLKTSRPVRDTTITRLPSLVRSRARSAIAVAASWKYEAALSDRPNV
jgi:hypothetical protein